MPALVQVSSCLPGSHALPALCRENVQPDVQSVLIRFLGSWTSREHDRLYESVCDRASFRPTIPDWADSIERLLSMKGIVKVHEKSKGRVY